MEKSVIEDLSKSEIARQSLIYELIQGEAAYLKDLNTIETVRSNFQSLEREFILQNYETDFMILGIRATFTRSLTSYHSSSSTR